MKKLIAATAALLLAGILLGWFFNSTQNLPAPAKTAAPRPPPVPTPLPVAATAPALSSVTRSNAQPVPAPTQTASIPVPAPATSPVGDAHRELNSAVKDMISLLEANDMGGFLLKYSSPKILNSMAQSFTLSRAKAAEFRTANNLPQLPDQTFEESLKALGQTTLAPAGRVILSELKALQTTTPKLNIAGDEAVYTLDPTLSATLPGNPESLTLRKENGQWFADALMN